MTTERDDLTNEMEAQLDPDAGASGEGATVEGAEAPSTPPVMTKEEVERLVEGLWRRAQSKIDQDTYRLQRQIEAIAAATAKVADLEAQLQELQALATANLTEEEKQQLAVQRQLRQAQAELERLKAGLQMAGGPAGPSRPDAPAGAGADLEAVKAELASHAQEEGVSLSDEELAEHATAILQDGLKGLARFFKAVEGKRPSRQQASARPSAQPPPITRTKAAGPTPTTLEEAAALVAKGDWDARQYEAWKKKRGLA